MDFECLRFIVKIIVLPRKTMISPKCNWYNFFSAWASPIKLNKVQFKMQSCKSPTYLFRFIPLPSTKQNLWQWIILRIHISTAQKGNHHRRSNELNISKINLIRQIWRLKFKKKRMTNVIAAERAIHPRPRKQQSRAHLDTSPSCTLTLPVYAHNYNTRLLAYNRRSLIFASPLLELFQPSAHTHTRAHNGASSREAIVTACARAQVLSNRISARTKKSKRPNRIYISLLNES